MSKEYTIIVHDIETDGYPPENLGKAGLTGRVGFIFDGSIYNGWPLRTNSSDAPWYPGDSINERAWEDSEYGHKMANVTKWVELPLPTWEL